MRPAGLRSGKEYMKILKKGNRCPCCGEPIKTDDGDALMILSWIADKGRLPTKAEVQEFYKMLHPPEAGEESKEIQ